MQLVYAGSACVFQQDDGWLALDSFLKGPLQKNPSASIVKSSLKKK